MSTRAVIWLLAVLVVALIVVPTVGMFGMMSTHWMTSSGGMMAGMTLTGLVWLLVGAVLVLLIREATKTP